MIFDLTHFIDILASEKAKTLVSNIGTLATACVAIVGLFNVRNWLKQTTINRRATIAAAALDELESFYSKLEELIEWEQVESWKEWCSSFKSIFQENFLKGKLKVHRLKEEEIDRKIKELENTARELLKAGRYCIHASEPGVAIQRTVEDIEKDQEKFDKIWKTFKVKWEEVNEYLTHIGLYERKITSNTSQLKSP